MATIQLGAHGARKSLDAQVLLVPFIDLLLCSSAAGEHQRVGGELSALRDALQSWRKLNASAELTVSAEDGVQYASLIDAVDMARAAGFDRLTIGGER